MTGANVARAMQLSAPTVHEMIGRLERDGYVTRGADKALAFTDNGREHAEGVVRRHRLIERFLTDVLGIPWDEVHEEAERLEHAMSPVLEARMLAAIGDAKTCPHGHPINVGERIVGVPLGDVEGGATVRIVRFENEAEDLLHYLKDAGIEPGVEGTVAEKRRRPRRRRLRRPQAESHAPWPRRCRSWRTPRRRRARRCPSSSCSPRTATGARSPVTRPGAASTRGGRRARRGRGGAAWRRGRRRAGCRAARCQAGGVRAAEVGDDVRALDQRAGDRPGLVVAERDVRAARAGSRGEPSAKPSGASHASCSAISRSVSATPSRAARRCRPRR